MPAGLGRAPLGQGYGLQGLGVGHVADEDLHQARPGGAGPVQQGERRGCGGEDQVEQVALRRLPGGGHARVSFTVVTTAQRRAA